MRCLCKHRNMAADFIVTLRYRVTPADGFCGLDGSYFGVHLLRWYKTFLFVCLPWSDCRCFRFISDYKLMNYRTPRRFNYRPSARQKIHRVSFFTFVFFSVLTKICIMLFYNFIWAIFIRGWSLYPLIDVCLCMEWFTLGLSSCIFLSTWP